MNRVFRVGDESYVLYCGLDLKGHPLFLRIGAGAENLEKYENQIKTEYVYYPNSMIGSLVNDLIEAPSSLKRCVVLGKNQQSLKILIEKYRKDIDFISTEDFGYLSPKSVIFQDTASGMSICLGQDTIFNLDEIEEKNGHFNYRAKELRRNSANSTHMYPKKFYDGEGFFTFRNGLYLFTKDRFVAVTPDIAFIEGLYHCGFNADRIDTFLDGRNESFTLERFLRFLNKSKKQNVLIAGVENQVNKDIFPFLVGKEGTKRVSTQNITVGNGRKIKMGPFVFDYISEDNIRCTFPSGKILFLRKRGEDSSSLKSNEYHINMKEKSFSFSDNGNLVVNPLLDGIPVKFNDQDMAKDDVAECYLFELGDDIRSGSFGAGLRSVQILQKFFKDLKKTTGEGQNRFNSVLNNLIKQLKLVKKELKRSEGYLPLFYLWNSISYMEGLLAENGAVHPNLCKNFEKVLKLIKSIAQFSGVDSTVFPLQVDFTTKGGGYLFRSSIGSISRSNLKYFGTLMSGHQTFSAIIDKCTQLDIKHFGEFLYAWKAKGSMGGKVKGSFGAPVDLGDRLGNSSKKAVKKVAKKVEEEMSDEARRKKQKSVLGKLKSNPLLFILVLIFLLALLGGGVFFIVNLRIKKMEAQANVANRDSSVEDGNNSLNGAGSDEDLYDDRSVPTKFDDNVAEIVYSDDVVVTMRDIRLVTNKIAVASGFDNLNRESVNLLPDPAYIENGMVLKIPDGTEHIVVLGDTMWDIAESYARIRVQQDFDLLNSIIEDMRNKDLESETIIQHEKSVLILSKESPSATLREMALKVSKEF